MPEINELSDREREILYLVATGASNKQIAQKLYISTNTVKVHLRNVFTKIGVTSRTEAAMYAVSIGMVEPVSSPGGEGVSVLSGSDEVEGGKTRLSGELDHQAWMNQRRWRIGWVIAFFIIVTIGSVGFFALRADGENNPSALSGTPSSESPRWQNQSPLPSPRSGLAVVSYENRIYAIGGENDEGITGQLDRYDPIEDRWTTLSPKPLPVRDAGASVIGGLIYIPGGRTKSGSLTNTLEVYDPDTDEWEQRQPLPLALSAFATVSFEGKLYIFGGWDGIKYLKTVYEYDPSQDKWNKKKDMPTPRGYAGAAVAGGKVFVMAGFDGQNALAVNEIYLPERDDGVSDPWSRGSPLPQGRYAIGIASIADIIHVVGGQGQETESLPALEYSPQSDEWQMFERPEVDKWSYLGMVALETHLYALGGITGDTPSSLNMSYQAIYTISIPLVR
jgi:DNA-binding CsgD family transcriptional regulator/N-acetylneuraminic acid mutarotase